MMFSIITPTICRQTLLRTCESIDKQNHQSYEHIVCLDGPESGYSNHVEIKNTIRHQRRRVIHTETRTRDFGNSQRHMACQQALGDYLLYIDDDDFYLGMALPMIENAILKLRHKPGMAVFPCLRYGTLYFTFPPWINQTVSCQWTHRRTLKGKPVLWPKDNASYASDGFFLEHVKSLATPVKLDIKEPVVCVERSRFGI